MENSKLLARKCGLLRILVVYSSRLPERLLNCHPERSEGSAFFENATKSATRSPPSSTTDPRQLRQRTAVKLPAATRPRREQRTKPACFLPIHSPIEKQRRATPPS